MIDSTSVPMVAENKSTGSVRSVQQRRTAGESHVSHAVGLVEDDVVTSESRSVPCSTRSRGDRAGTTMSTPARASDGGP